MVYEKLINILNTMIAVEEGKHPTTLLVGSTRVGYEIDELHNTISVYFGGTMQTPYDWFENFQALTETVNGVNVHKGFLYGLNTVLQILALENIQLKTFDYVRFVGYSQGGAQAAIAPLILDLDPKKCESIGFCAPMSIYAGHELNEYKYSFVNIVNPFDFVPDMPFSIMRLLALDAQHKIKGWRHVGNRVAVLAGMLVSKRTLVGDILRRIARTWLILKSMAKRLWPFSWLKLLAEYKHVKEYQFIEWHSLYRLRENLTANVSDGGSLLRI